MLAPQIFAEERKEFSFDEKDEHSVEFEFSTNPKSELQESNAEAAPDPAQTGKTIADRVREEVKL